MTNNVGQSNPFSDASEYNTLAFIIARALDKVQTVSIVEVTGVNTTTQIVDVLPLVNIVTGAGVSIQHGVIYQRPYFRLQGGSSGIICDPAPGDIGICVFASRDSTAVQAAKGLANPGSQRKFSWSDGFYFGGVLNANPTQYVKFLPGGAGIDIVTPGTVSFTTPTVTASGTIHGATLSAGDGFTGSFATGDSRTVVVVDGIITGVV